MAPSVRIPFAAPLLEVFASIQGEGLFAGEPQVFVRLRGCPLRCAWCDTPGSWRVGDAPPARVAVAGGRSERVPSWSEPARALELVERADPGGARPVSITGGEPLLWPEFVRELARLARPRRVHLETAAAHPRALARVLPEVAHASLDLKLPSDLAPPEPEAGAGTGEPPPRTASDWAAVRAAVLSLVRGHPACAKVVVAGGRPAGRFAPLLDDVRRLAPELPLVLTPATPVRGVPAPSAREVDAVLGEALARGLDVRVVPQLHRVLGVP